MLERGYLFKSQDNHRMDVLSQREGKGKPTQSPWVCVTAESHRPQLRNVATGNPLHVPYLFLWLNQWKTTYTEAIIYWLVCANKRQHVKISAQWIEIWLINSTESFLLGNLRERGKVKPEAIKEQRQRSWILSVIMTRVEGAMEGAAWKTAKWPGTNGASRGFTCLFFQ